MTLYLFDDTPPSEIDLAKESDFVIGVKCYPANATTNSAAGVTDMEKCSSVFERMQELGMPLLLHGEVTDPSVDVFDREAVFLDKVFGPLRRKFPQLKIVLEHITTRAALLCMFHEKRLSHPTAATVTAQREEDRLALLAAVTSGSKSFFLGTDSAPHAKQTKEAEHGCAGCYTAFGALELYAEAFDSVGKLSMLEGFASHNCADFYGLPRNNGKITLVREEQNIPRWLTYGRDVVVPFRAGGKLQWTAKKKEVEEAEVA